MMNRYLQITSVILIMLLSTCASKNARQEKEASLFAGYTEKSEEKYSEYLVDTKRYTSDGIIYHEKYKKYLITIASQISEKNPGYGRDLARGSIGFYYDRKSIDKNKLYIGFDVISTEKIERDPSLSAEVEFAKRAVSYLRRDLKIFVSAIYPFKTVLDEKNILGLVVGWRWKTSSGEESFSIWIPKNDLVKYEESRLTFEELVERATITNSSGKIIKLPI